MLEHTHFGLPEAGFGPLPAHSALYVVWRVDLTRPRRLVCTALRRNFDGAEGRASGWCADERGLETVLSRVLGEILHCALRSRAACIVNHPHSAWERVTIHTTPTTAAAPETSRDPRSGHARCTY